MRAAPRGENSNFEQMKGIYWVKNVIYVFIAMGAVGAPGFGTNESLKHFSCGRRDPWEAL